MPLSFAPGEAYQFDWSHEVVLIGGITTKVKVAHLRLCHSRMFYVRAYPRESQEMVFDAHDRAFAFLGGACQRGIYDKFAEAFTAKVNAFKLGSGYGEGITHGPLIHDRAVEKVTSHVEDAVKQGGKVLTGGNRVPELGENFFQPTVIRYMTPNMAIAHDETFGPVAGLFPFETEAEVIAQANDTEVGLAGYFFSKDIQRCYRVAEALEVGMVGVNTGLIPDPAAPFGGVKQSGFGREGSRYGIDEYMVTKMVTLGGMGQELQGSS